MPNKYIVISVSEKDYARLKELKQDRKWRQVLVHGAESYKIMEESETAGYNILKQVPPQVKQDGI